MDQPVISRFPYTGDSPNIVPLYHIHNIDAPFCNDPNCWCQGNKKEVGEIMQGVEVGELKIAQVKGDA